MTDAAWRRRHLGILVLLAVLAAGIVWVGVLAGDSAVEAAGRAVPTILFGLAAYPRNGGRRTLKSAFATLGLMVASSTFVYMSGGQIEAQFLYFLTLGLVALYHEWPPFLLAAISIPVRQVLMAYIEPGVVYHHSSVLHEPLYWALVQLAFVAAAGATNLIAWKASEEQLLRDPVTQLANRTFLSERIEIALAWPGRSVVLFIDLAGFRKITESFGHEVGDEVLREVAQRLCRGIRLRDHVARVGADQFAILMIDATEEMAQLMAVHVNDLLGTAMHVGDLELRVVANVGIATIGLDGDSAAELLRSAALAAEAAKRRHDANGAHQRFDRSMADDAVARLAAEIDLRAAVERSEFVLYYQPIVDIADGRLRGFEALVRWHSPSRGLVPPLEFIPLAEETGLIEPIGAWVLREATEQMARWRTQGWADGLSMSVNIAAAQLSAGSIVEQVDAALTHSGMRPGDLVLEVTESALADRTAPEVLGLLKELGVRIALDDFGTGYSSLAYVARLPIDIIKIDKTFTDEVPGGPNAALTDAVVAMAQRLGMQTVVEGIEHDHQVVALRAMGCTVGQGYYFHRPMPAEQADILLADAATHQSELHRRMRAAVAPANALRSPAHAL